MRHRTLTLLATPAVLGAMTVAVPALAGVEHGPAAHSPHPANASSRVSPNTACASAWFRARAALRGLPGGPRGSRGHRESRENGATGKTGATGKDGTRPRNTGATGSGSTGPTGPAGTARGFAVVQPNSPSQATLIGGVATSPVSRSSKKASIASRPLAPINAAEETVAVSPEVSYSSGKLPGLVAVNAQRTGAARERFRGRYLHTRRRVVEQLRLHDHRAVRVCIAAP